MQLRNARPHRFPPLAQVQARVSGPDGGDASQAFQQAMDQGYAEGLRTGKEAGEALGHKSGHAEGLRQGAEQARREVMEAFDTQAEPVEAILQALHNLQADYQEALRDEVVELVGKVARQVIRCELALQPLQLLTMVDETLATLPRVRAREVEVFLHPEDLQRITDLDPERAKKWKLLPDTRLEPGECHVRAGRHEADAGCRQRQAAVMDQVRAQLKGNGKDSVAPRVIEDDEEEDTQVAAPAFKVVR